MASISENRKKDGTIVSYRVRVCVGRDRLSGKQISLSRTFKRNPSLSAVQARREVERLAAEMEDKARRDFEQQMTEDSAKLTLRTFLFERWLPAVSSNIKMKTKENYSCRSALIIGFYGTDITLSEISPAQIIKFINYLQKKGLKPSTINTTLKIFSVALSFAERMEYIDRNPISRLNRSDKPKQEPKEIDFLTEAEAKDFLKALENEPLENKAIYQTLLFCGLRAGELCGLLWKDFDEKEAEFHIRRNVVWLKEKGATINTTKSGRDRFTPIPDPLIKTLLEHREETKKNYGDFSLEWFIFHTPQDPTKPRSPGSIEKRLKRLEARHNLRSVSPHDLRHSTASLLLAADGNIKNVQELLGHSDPGTTLKFYAGAERKRLHKNVGTMVEMLTSDEDEKGENNDG